MAPSTLSSTSRRSSSDLAFAGRAPGPPVWGTPTALHETRRNGGSDFRLTVYLSDTADGSLMFLGNPADMVTGAYDPANTLDRKSTRLNSSHLGISYAVFCLE